LPNDKSINRFYLRAGVAFAIAEDGDVYMWGSLNDTEDLRYLKSITFLYSQPKLLKSISLKPQKTINLTISFQPFLFDLLFLDLRDIHISKMACSNSACIFLSSDGILYSCGYDINLYGILGLGEIYEQPTPHPISSLLSQKYFTIN
jgi:alpha-tubulin suppressor-like RCC1 family protein